MESKQYECCMQKNIMEKKSDETIEYCIPENSEERAKAFLKRAKRKKTHLVSNVIKKDEKTPNKAKEMTESQKE